MTTIIVVGIACIVALSIGFILGKATNRPTAPDLDGLIEAVRSYPDPEKAVYMIVRKVRGERYHIHANPTKRMPNPAVSGADE